MKLIKKCSYLFKESRETLLVKVQNLKDSLPLKLLTENTNLSSEITGCYIGDLLSWVMANANNKNVWITVMGNINAIAVAALNNISCIILAENASLDEDAKAKAIEHNIPIFVTDLNSYNIAVKISKLLET